MLNDPKVWIIICLVALLILMVISNISMWWKQSPIPTSTTSNLYTPTVVGDIQSPSTIPSSFPPQAPLHGASLPPQAPLHGASLPAHKTVVASSRDCVPSTDVVRRTPANQRVNLTPALPPILAPAPTNFNTNGKRDSKGEKECRRVLEMIYNKPFAKTRDLPWLFNDRPSKNGTTGNRMELDGYNAELGIGFEYMGEQHYDSEHYWNKSYEDFVEQVYRDERKVNLCDENGVYLITIPYNVRIEDIEAYIRYYLPEAVLARQQQYPFTVESQISTHPQQHPFTVESQISTHPQQYPFTVESQISTHPQLQQHPFTVESQIPTQPQLQQHPFTVESQIPTQPQQHPFTVKSQIPTYPSTSKRVLYKPTYYR